MTKSTRAWLAGAFLGLFFAACDSGPGGQTRAELEAEFDDEASEVDFSARRPTTADIGLDPKMESFLELDLDGEEALFGDEEPVILAEPKPGDDVPPEVKLLTRQVKRGERMERIQAALALREMGEEGQGAVSGLLKMLQDPDVSVRMTSAIALGGVTPADHEQAIKVLSRVLREDSSPVVRVECANALAEINPIDALLRRPIWALRVGLNAPDQRVREASAAGLDVLRKKR